MNSDLTIPAVPGDGSERWLPVAFTFAQTLVSVRWIAFRQKAVDEPFFGQTLRRLRAMKPPASERITDAKTFFSYAKMLPPMLPCGLIFHVSRCGSTFLANALRTDPHVSVLSEARPVGTFFHPGTFRNTRFPLGEWTNTRRTFLNALISMYAHHAGGPTTKMVIKCHAASLLEISLIRIIWPSVPFVILIRDPLEVLVSNLATPSGWVKSRNAPLNSRTPFGWTAQEAQGMSMEEFATRGLAQFCDAGAKAVGDNCKVIDYGSLNPDKIAHVADFFGITLPPASSPGFMRVLQTWAKDPTGQREFEDDRAQKRASASDLAKECVSKYAQSSYSSLRQLDASWNSSSAIRN